MFIFKDKIDMLKYWSNISNIFAMLEVALIATAFSKQLANRNGAGSLFHHLRRMDSRAFRQRGQAMSYYLSLFIGGTLVALGVYIAYHRKGWIR